MDAQNAKAMLRRLHRAQGEFYAGRLDNELRRILAEDVVWMIPGNNSIAGRYRGVEEVMRYFAKRRDLASNTFRLEPGEVLVGDRDRVAVFTDGIAVLGGKEQRWSTIGVYRLRERQVFECQLVPLDPELFDRIWSRG